MNENGRTVECAIHGETQATFLCRHLAEDSQQRWFCDYPSAENPWPDAWCADCERIYQAEGEWNEVSEARLDIRVACHCCYEERKGSSVAQIMAARAEDWGSLVSAAADELQEKQDRLQDLFDLSQHQRWDWEQASGQIVFSNDGVPAVAADIQFVGSISTNSNTWLWSWANATLAVHLYSDLFPLRVFGEEHGFANLTVPKWPAEEGDGWDMTAVAAKVLGAEGVYRAPSDSGFSFLLMNKLRWLNS